MVTVTAPLVLWCSRHADVDNQLVIAISAQNNWHQTIETGDHRRQLCMRVVRSIKHQPKLAGGKGGNVPYGTWVPVAVRHVCKLLYFVYLRKYSSLQRCLTAPATHVPYGITKCCLPATRQRWHFRLFPSQFRLVLDLATPEGCKAELTWVNPVKRVRS